MSFDSVVSDSPNVAEIVKHFHEDLSYLIALLDDRAALLGMATCWICDRGDVPKSDWRELPQDLFLVRMKEGGAYAGRIQSITDLHVLLTLTSGSRALPVPSVLSIHRCLSVVCR
ncbi:hypothetical protein [Maricaulis maris]|uniref:hypothetical protein n=1 Tax=Maricaulis maris TaxID=74318 RepID=UPI003B8DD965